MCVCVFTRTRPVVVDCAGCLGTGAGARALPERTAIVAVQHLRGLAPAHERGVPRASCLGVMSALTSAGVQGEAQSRWAALGSDLRNACCNPSFMLLSIGEMSRGWW